MEILFKRPMPSTTLCALCKQINIIIKMFLDRKNRCKSNLRKFCSYLLFLFIKLIYRRSTYI